MSDDGASVRQGEGDEPPIRPVGAGSLRRIVELILGLYPFHDLGVCVQGCILVPRCEPSVMIPRPCGELILSFLRLDCDAIDADHASCATPVAQQSPESGGEVEGIVPAVCLDQDVGVQGARRVIRHDEARSARMMVA